MMKRISLIAALAIGAAAPVMAQTTSQPSAPATSTSATTTYPTVSATDLYSSKLKGLNVYNQDQKTVGEIQDIAFTDNREVQAYIVSVGGFLGVGERYVAVNPAAVSIKWDAAGKKWNATMNATVEQLKAAPEFKYPS